MDTKRDAFSIKRMAHNSKIYAAATAFAMVVLVAGQPAAAVASDATGDTNRIAEQVSQAAPDGLAAVPARVSGNAAVSSANNVDAAVLLDGSGTVDVKTSVGGNLVNARISLPNQSSPAAGKIAHDGTVVFGGAGDDALTVQTLPDGSTRVHTVIPDANAPLEHEYGMEGFRASMDEQGNAAFVSTDAEGAIVPVERPWATDANGNAVETRYEVRGSKLVQIVVPHTDTAYPIIADPTWGWRNAAWGLTLSRSETAAIKDYAAAAGMCATLAKRAPAFSVACGAWASYLQVQAATANRQNPPGCLHIVVAPLPGAISHTYC